MWLIINDLVINVGVNVAKMLKNVGKGIIIFLGDTIWIYWNQM